MLLSIALIVLAVMGVGISVGYDVGYKKGYQKGGSAARCYKFKP